MMKLYDMITKFDEELVNDLPLEIQECLRNPDTFGDRNKSTEIIDLEYIWGITKKVCKLFIDQIQSDSAMGGCGDFLEDIKYHSIINIFLSIKNRSIDKMELNKLQPIIYDYYDICWKLFKNKKEKRYKTYQSDKRDFYDNFMRKVYEWENENSLRDKQSINWGSDFIFCFDNSLELSEEGIQNIRLDSGIFFEVIKNWKDSPYNQKNMYGMRFARLKVFYETLENVLETKSNKIDKIITAYTIERLFNITFVYELASFFNEKFHEHIKQLILFENLVNAIEIVLRIQNNYDQKKDNSKEVLSRAVKSTLKKEVVSYIMKFINKMEEYEVKQIIKAMRDVRKLADIKKVLDTLKDNIIVKDGNKSKNRVVLDYIDSLRKKLEKIQYQEEYKNKSLVEFLMIIRDIKPNKSKIRGSIANSLCILTDIVSIPMVFSRKKYIRSLYDLIEKCDTEDYMWEFKFRHKLQYINASLIPLLSKVYYYLIYSTVKDENMRDDETLNCIGSILEDYIIKNEKIYHLEQITLGKENNSIFYANDTSEGFQVNVTEMIYNYQYKRKFVGEYTDVIEFFKELDSEENIKEEILRHKYNQGDYYLNFPYNMVYSAYYNKNNDKL